MSVLSFHAQALAGIVSIYLFVGTSLVHAADSDPQTEITEQAPKARAILDGWQADHPQRAQRAVHIVYWTPSDREPAARYRERLSAIFEETRAFFAREMERNGFGPRTIQLVKEADELCKIHVVKGVKSYAQYENKSGAEIRSECVPVLRAAGLDADKETIVIFCNMANWDAEKRTMTQNSPYYASGTNLRGTAWQVDSPLLDLALLDAREPLLQDGQYGRISPGKYNSIFIGGVIHELGHALGLPHNRERPDQKALWGSALMGSGNRTYGDERRGEGPGTFLTLGEAMRLASHPIFCGSVKGFEMKANARLSEVKLESKGTTFTFSGRVQADPPVYAVIGYTDPAGGSNYDATTATAVPDAEGRFTSHCDALQPGKAAMLHVIAAQANGAMSSFSSFGGEPRFAYAVNKDGQVDLWASTAKDVLAQLIAALNSGKLDQVQEELAVLKTRKVDAKLMKVAEALAGTIGFVPGPMPGDAEGNVCELSKAQTTEAKVGWGKPTYNRLPEKEPLLLAGSRVFANGVYAHAPARHVWTLGMKWGRLKGVAGMAQGHPGSVVFTVSGDGRALWRSGKIEDGQAVSFDVDVKGVEELALVVSDAGDGTNGDWGLWLEPVLVR